MKTRKTVAILGAGLILACCVMIYLMLDVTLFPLGHNFKTSVKDVSNQRDVLQFLLNLYDFYILLL